MECASTVYNYVDQSWLIHHYVISYFISYVITLFLYSLCTNTGYVVEQLLLKLENVNISNVTIHLVYAGHDFLTCLEIPGRHLSFS